MRARLLPLVALLVLAGAAPAGAQAPPVTVAATAAETGWVGVTVSGPPGTQVVLAENGRTLRGLTIGPGGATTVRHLAPWMCAGQTRSIVASVAGAPVAATSVVTPPCGGRFTVSAPGTVRAGAPIAARIGDRWRVGGVKTLVCLRMRGHNAQCVAAEPGPRARVVHLTPVRRGTATVTVTTPWSPTVQATVRVRARTRPLRVLAAGDSMMQILDAAIADRLAHARVRSDTHVSTGITKPAMLNWPAQARRLARAQHPDATVVFLGANDGFGLPLAGGRQEPCCSDAWVAAYAARAREMMAAYARAGAGRVYWLTLPVPRSAALAEVYAAVNRALVRAAAAFRATVRIVDLVPAISPGARFRPALRQRDGVHLTPAGDRVAAGLVVAAMRRDGLVG